MQGDGRTVGIMSSLDFEQTVSHLHGLLGRHVEVRFHNDDLPVRGTFAGFKGRLGHAKKPEVAELHAASGVDRGDVFYLGDDSPDHSWFTIDERTFTNAELTVGKNDAVSEELKVDVDGLHVVIVVDRPR
jgi:hypothetical protein